MFTDQARLAEQVEYLLERTTISDLLFAFARATAGTGKAMRI